MPQIIVMADTPSQAREQPVMFTERVSVSDFESRHFQTQLVERLGWAVSDAHAVEQNGNWSQEADRWADEPDSGYVGELVSDAQPVS
jgi:hypothetical protein